MLSRWRRRRRVTQPRPQRTQPLTVEALEERTVPSTIVWTNRGTPTDTFTAAERAVIGRAIAIWQGLIPDFRNGSNIYNITFTGGIQSTLDLGEGVLGLGGPQFVTQGAVTTLVGGDIQ